MLAGLSLSSSSKTVLKRLEDGEVDDADMYEGGRRGMKSRMADYMDDDVPGTSKDDKYETRGIIAQQFKLRRQSTVDNTSCNRMS